MTGREKQKLPFTGLYNYMTNFTLYIQHVYDMLTYGKMKLGMCMDFTEASQFWIALLKCTPNMKKLWFREIIPAKTCKNCKNCCLGKLDQAQEKIKNCPSMELLVKSA